jgi:hypothetical protein
MGRPDMAAHFKEAQNVPFTLLVDHTKESYRLMEMGRGSLMAVIGPKVWARAAKSLVTGHGLQKARQDPLQMGGAVVVDRDGEVLFTHHSKDSSDNVPVADLLAALP